MAYKITWSPKSLEDLKGLERDVRLRIIRKVENLKLAPYHFIERLTDCAAWKLKVGDYRVILDIGENKKEVIVLKVSHRKNIYKRF